MGYYGGNNGSFSYQIVDADADTRVTVERTADDDTIRFDLGGASPITNALTINQTSGYVWNAGADDLDYILGTQNVASAFVLDGANDTAQFNVETEVAVDGSSVFQVASSGGSPHFVVTTGDLGAGGLGTSCISIRPNGGAGLTAGSQFIIPFSVNSSIGGSGTQSANYWGANIITGMSGASVKSASGDIRGMMSETFWASTGACSSSIIGLQTSSFVGGGSSVAAGTVSTQIGNRVQYGYYSGVGTGNTSAPASGAITNGYGLYITSPNGTSATNLVTNARSLRIDDVIQTGITNAWAISTGTGDVEFGDRVIIDGSKDSIQLRVQGHSTQTTNLVVFENSAGDDQFTFSNTGDAVFNEQGNAASLRVETDDDTHAIYVDGPNDSVGFGTSDTDLAINGLTVIPKVIIKDGAGDSNISLVVQSDSDAAPQGAFCVFARSRGSGAGAYAAVQSGDRIGVFRADAFEGTEFVTGASMSFVADAAPSGGKVATRIDWATDDGSSGVISRMTLDSNGRLGIGIGAPFAELDVRGAVLFNNNQGDNDLRWASMNAANMLRGDANIDALRIGSSAGTGALMDFFPTYVEHNRLNADIDFIANANGVADAFKIDAGNKTAAFKIRLQGNKGADVTSGSTITLGDGNYFDVTGTTTINHMTTTNWQAGSVIQLQFDSGLTVTHNAAAPPANTAPILLAGAANFGATTDDTLQLVYDGVVWRELSRTVI